MLDFKEKILLSLKVLEGKVLCPRNCDGHSQNDYSSRIGMSLADAIYRNV